MTLLVAKLFKFFCPLRVLDRLEARRQARWWIAEIEAVGDDWQLADRLWQYIETWMNAKPTHCAEFLRLFRKHHSGRRFAPIERPAAHKVM